MLALWFGRASAPGWWMASSATSTDAYMLSTIWERWALQVGGGHLPLWFPEFAGGGHPVHAAWMYGLFYPPLALFLVLPPETAWTGLAIAHLVFGGAGMYRFLRAEGRDGAAAASGAVVFAVSHFMVGRIVAGHLNLVMPFAWVPWVLLATRRVVHGERGAVGWLALCAAMGLLAGHVQIWFYAAPVIAAYAVMEAKSAGRVRSAWKPLVTAAALVLGIAAIQWVPAWELFRVSGHPPEDARVILDCSAPASALVGQLAPALWSSNDPLAHEFSGLGGPLAVAAVLFAFKLRDRRRWFWFGVLALGLVLAMGLRNPVSEFVNELPPFRFARAPGRAMTLVVLAGSVLAAHAVADIVPAAAKWRMAVPAAFVASALVVGVPTIQAVKSDFYEFDWSKTLPAAAAGHRVNVVGKRYPYLERFGVGTLRDVCPLDTPGYKALIAQRSPAIAWWFDLGAEIEVPWNGPPGDRAATESAAMRAGVRTFEAPGRAIRFPAAQKLNSSDELLTRLRSGEQSLAVDECDFDPAVVNTAPSFPGADRGSTRVYATSPTTLMVESDKGYGGWFLLSHKWYPGWEQYDDSEGWSPVCRGNLAFIALPARRWTQLEYRPGWLWLTLLASSASLVAAVVIVVRGRSPR